MVFHPSSSDESSLLDLSYPAHTSSTRSLPETSYPALSFANPTHPSSFVPPLDGFSNFVDMNTLLSEARTEEEEKEGHESDSSDQEISLRDLRQRMQRTGTMRLVSPTEAPPPSPAGEIPEKRVVIAMNDTEFCYELLRWTLDHLFSVRYPFASSPNARACFRFKIVIAHAQQVPFSLARFCGVGPSDYIPLEENDRTTQANNVERRARQICTGKGVPDPIFDIRSGHVEKVLLAVAIQQEATILVVGSHGSGFMKRLFVGSVADSCARKANCPVMIVRAPVIRQPPGRGPEINQPPRGEPQINKQPGREPVIRQPPGGGPKNNQQPGREPQIDQPPVREPGINPQPGGGQQGN